MIRFPGAMQRVALAKRCFAEPGPILAFLCGHGPRLCSAPLREVLRAALRPGNEVARAARHPLRRPSAVRFHCATFSAMMRVDFIAAWLSWA